MSVRQLRAGIVGTGAIARAHAAAIRSQDRDVRLVAVTDLDDERASGFRAEWDVPRSYRSVPELLAAEELDLVSVCTPPGAHTDAAVACLEAGVNVLCEKPPCLTLAEFDRITAAERVGDRYFAGVFQHRFGGAVVAARRAVESGVWGRPLVAVCHTLWYRDDAYYRVEWRGRWRTEGGGPTIGHGVHQIDLLGHLLGDWRTIGATAPRLARDVETEDVSVAHVTFENGAVASVVCSVLSPVERTYLRIDLTGGTLELEPGGDAGAQRFVPAPGGQPQSWDFADRPGSHETQLGETVRALRAGHRPPSSGPGLRRTVELVTGIYAAAFGSGRVDRADLVPGHRFYDRIEATVPTGGA